MSSTLLGPAASAAPAAPIIGGLESRQELRSAFAGRVLLAELGCTACHATSDPLLVSKPGPDLSAAGSRVRANHLQRFIADPSGTKPGTTMPDVLGHLAQKEREEAALALAQYLASLRTGPLTIEPVPPDAVARGRRLYHSVGCVACHSPEQELPGSVPLGPLADKYSLGSLTAFLKDPLAVRPGGRMPDLHLEHHEASDIAAYLLRDQRDPAEATVVQTGLVARGATLFAELRCHACHAIGGRNTAPMSVGLAEVRPDRGCLSDATGDWPRYPLSAEQRVALRAALTTLDEATRPGDEEAIQVLLTQFNCVACHQRNGQGGIAESRDPYFTTQDPNLGEQGRVPPTLTGVGAKLRPEWLRKVLVQGVASRPYCNTRMPAFGAGPVTALLDRLAAADQLPPVTPVPVAEENEFKRAGRDLAGTDGLSCVTCHTFRNQQTGAMGSLDMTLMAQRVTRDWFHHYLAEPQRFSPSTLMPAFWSAGQPPKPEILGGDRDRQIEALWRYLSDGYSTDAPAGVRREPMRLLSVDGEAVMLRRSYPVVGKRGIGVGYPGGVNLVFNAEQLCLAMIWQGDFADPAGVWTSQGHGTVRPLSRERHDFTNTPELAALERIDAPWPVIEGRPPNHHFLGYRLDAQRRPAFHYRFGDTDVEDYFEDLREGDRVVLRRTLTFAAPPADGELVFRAATGPGIALADGNRFTAGPSLEIAVRGETSARIVETDGSRDLRVPVQLKNGRAQVVLEYRWQSSIQ